MDVQELNPNRTCVQWGQGDSDHIRKELGLGYKEYVFRPRIWDVKSLYQIHQAFKNDAVAAGLEKALKTVGMEFEGRPHDALNDALNTYRIFYELGKKTIQFDKIEKIVNNTK